MAAVAGVAALVLSIAPTAVAAPSLSCSGVGGVIEITVSGAASPSDELRVDATSADWSVTLKSGGSSTTVCASDAFPVGGTNGYTGAVVTGSQLPVIFAPGHTAGLSFVGEPAATNTIDAAGLPAGAVVHTNGHISGLGGGGSDTYAQIVNFTDSGPGGITFASDGTLGGLNLQGAPNDTLDYTSATTGVTFFGARRHRQRPDRRPDQFSGFGRSSAPPAAATPSSPAPPAA